MNNEKMNCTIGDLFLEVGPNQSAGHIKLDTMEIVDPLDYLLPCLPENPTEEDYEKLPRFSSFNIYLLPNYDFIEHKNIMSEYAHGIYNNKDARKELFYALRNHDYKDKFCDCLKKYNLYDDFRNYSSDYYNFVFKLWFKERYKIEL